MNMAALEDPKNLGWFEKTKYGKKMSWYDVYTYGTSMIPFTGEATESSEVDNLLGKFENAVESITTKYINNDEAVFGSLGDWIWARLRGLLLTVFGEAIPPTVLSATAFGFPIGSVGLAAGVGFVLGYIAYYYASAFVIHSYTGDASAFSEAHNNARWILLKVAHLSFAPMAASQLGRMFGSFNYVFSAYGLFAAIILGSVVPSLIPVAIGVTGMAITATAKTANMVAVANKGNILFPADPRLITKRNTYMEDTKALIELLETMRTEFMNTLKKDSKQAMSLKNNIDLVALQLNEKQAESNAGILAQVMTQGVVLQIEGLKNDILRLEKSTKKDKKKILLLKNDKKKEVLLLENSNKPLLITQGKDMASGSLYDQDYTEGDFGYTVNPDVSVYESDLTEEMSDRTGISTQDLSYGTISNSVATLRRRLPHGKGKLISRKEWAKSGQPPTGNVTLAPKGAI